MATIAERLKEALEIRKMKQADLVRETGLGKSSISTYLSGAYEPKQRSIYKIAQVLKVNPAWLLGNEDVPMDAPGEKLNQSSSAGSGYASWIELKNQEALSSLSYQDLELIAHYFNVDMTFLLGIPNTAHNDLLEETHPPAFYALFGVDGVEVARAFMQANDGTKAAVRKLLDLPDLEE